MSSNKVPALVGTNSITKGEDVSITLKFVDAAGSAIDLTGYTAGASIDDQPLEATTPGTNIADFTPDYTDAANGTITLTMSKTVTAAIAVKGYIWDMWLRDSTGLVTYMIPNRAEVILNVTDNPA
ncbi:MAG: hypothetical protein AAFX39_12595 [Pseudomonadota bacterium]